jgi:hypothetical protein
MAIRPNHNQRTLIICSRRAALGQWAGLGSLQVIHITKDLPVINDASMFLRPPRKLEVVPFHRPVVAGVY